MEVSAKLAAPGEINLRLLKAEKVGTIEFIGGDIGLFCDGVEGIACLVVHGNCDRRAALERLRTALKITGTKIPNGWKFDAEYPKEVATTGA